MPWEGAKVTLLVGLSAVPVALVLGPSAPGPSSPPTWSPAAWLALWHDDVRGVPELVLILLVYYGVTIVLQRLLAFATGGEVLIDIDPFSASMLTR